MKFYQKVILITGGTGTLGKAVTRELLKYDPLKIRIFSRGEYLQSEMHRELHDPRLRFLIGDVRDKERLSRAMNGVDYVIHTAAMKRVESCEYNPMEAHRTNVDGAENIVNCALDNGVEKVLAISSDKAVNPINVYGATKKLAEKIILGGNIYSKGRPLYSIIRSGNFTESRGNVKELWKKQAKTGTITVTDLTMTRYWIKLEDVARFTVETLQRMEGNEIFIPKMKEESVAEAIKRDYPECKTVVIGKRPGERLHEPLFSEDEEPIDMGDYWLIKVKQAGGN